jgi:hypothetical protein
MACLILRIICCWVRRNDYLWCELYPKCQYFIFMHFFSISPQNNITYPNVCMDIISLSTKYVFMVVSSLSIQITLWSWTRSLCVLLSQNEAKRISSLRSLSDSCLYKHYQRLGQSFIYCISISLTFILGLPNTPYINLKQLPWIYIWRICWRFSRKFVVPL